MSIKPYDGSFSLGEIMTIVDELATGEATNIPAPPVVVHADHYFMPYAIPLNPPKDFQSLRDEQVRLRKEAKTRHVTLMAVAPQEAPPTIMTGTTPGIYPVR